MNSSSKIERVHKIRPLRERQREDSAREILAAAEAVFASRGLHGARMEEIAARAGVSVGTLYNRFDDRDALLAAVAAQRRAELIDKLDRALDAADEGPFRERLTSLVATVFAHFEEHRAFLGIVLQGEMQRSFTGIPAGSKPPEALRPLYARLEKQLLRGLAEGALRPGPVSVWAALLMGSVKALLLHEVLQPGVLEPGALAATAVSFFLEGAGS